MTTLRDTLSSTALRRLLAAQIPADFADWLDFVAIGALLAFSWQADPFVFALLAVAFGLPYLLIGPIAGVLVDRMSINSVLILSNLGRAGATVALAFAPNWQILLPLVFVRNSVDAFYTPAKQAALQAFTTDASRMSANGLSHAINQASKIAAPGLGGGLLIILAPQGVFFLNAVVSLAAAAFLIRLPRVPRPEVSGSSNPMLVEIRAGLSLVAKNAQLKGAFILTAAGYFSIFMYDTLIAPLTRELGFDATVLGLALSSVGLGGITGALMLGLGKDQHRPFLWVTFGSLLSGLTVSTLWLVEITNTNLSVPVFLLPFALAGIAGAVIQVPIRSVIQTETPPDRIARVTALNEALNTTALLSAPFVGAAIASAFGYGSAFLAGGVLMVIVAFYAFRLHQSDA
ncbi:MAG: MFS transporter [Rhodobacteraceae bacterium]|nr:MFS transporter [Paracoccaceae bacterium]